MKKFIKKYAVLALLLGLSLVGSDALAQTPSYILETFDPSTAGTEIKNLIVTVVIPALGIVFGALFGIVVLRWLYRKIVGALGR